MQKKGGTWSLWAGKAVAGRGMGFHSIVYSFVCVNALTHTHTAHLGKTKQHKAHTRKTSSYSVATVLPFQAAVIL